MPKRSDYAIALGLLAPPGPTSNRSSNRRDRTAPNAADGFYFQLESFLDSWRRQGTNEDAVRAALERARHTSLAMEVVGNRLAGR
jgi:hypothetical protein